MNTARVYRHDCLSLEGDSSRADSRVEDPPARIPADLQAARIRAAKLDLAANHSTPEARLTPRGRAEAALARLAELTGEKPRGR
jgi:hypothetical protein